jgi:hypothetical protein
LSSSESELEELEELDELLLALSLFELRLVLTFEFLFVLELVLKLYGELLVRAAIKYQINPPATTTTINPKHPAPPHPRAIFVFFVIRSPSNSKFQ